MMEEQELEADQSSHKAISKRKLRLPVPEHPLMRALYIILLSYIIYYSVSSVLKIDPEIARLSRTAFHTLKTEQIALDSEIPPQLQRYHTGKVLVVVVNSCLGCSKKILLTTKRLHSLLSPKGYTVLLVTQNHSEPLASLIKIFPYPIVSDPTKAVAKHLGVSTLPQIAEYTNGKVTWSKPDRIDLSEAVGKHLREIGLQSEVARLEKPYKEELDTLSKQMTDMGCTNEN